MICRVRSAIWTGPSCMTFEFGFGEDTIAPLCSKVASSVVLIHSQLENIFNWLNWSVKVFLSEF